MKTHNLKHDDRIRLASWVIHYATVGTYAGYRITHAPDIEHAGQHLFRAIDQNHDMVWCTFAGSALVNDGGAFYAREREKHAAATIVSDGDIAMVDGVRYRIRVVPGNAGEFPRNSDPIKFDLFDTAELSLHLRLWCLSHGIECQSADELLAEAKDYHHRNWLTRFIARWDEAVAFEDQHGNPEKTEIIEAGKALLEWAETMGGWDAPCWERFAKAIACAEGRLVEVQVQINGTWENVWGDTDAAGNRVPATFFSEAEAEAAIFDALESISADDGITRDSFRIAQVAVEGR